MQHVRSRLSVSTLLVLLVGCGTSHQTDAVRVALPSPTLTTAPTSTPLPTLAPSPTLTPIAVTRTPKPRSTVSDPGCPPEHPHCTTIINYPTGEDCGTPWGGGNLGASNTVSSPAGLTLTVAISPCHVGKKRAGEEKGENSIYLETDLVRPASRDVSIEVSWGDGTSENLIKKPMFCGGRDFGKVSYGTVGHQWTTAGKKWIHVHYVIQTCEPQPSSSPSASPDPGASASPAPSPSPFTPRTLSIDITVPVIVHDTTPWIIHH